jgi:hypothetical protein
MHSLKKQLVDWLPSENKKGEPPEIPVTVRDISRTARTEIKYRPTPTASVGFRCRPTKFELPINGLFATIDSTRPIYAELKSCLKDLLIPVSFPKKHF